MQMKEKLKQYLALKDEIDKLKQQQDILKDSIKLEMEQSGQKKYADEFGVVTIYSMSRENLNKKALREIMGENLDQYITKTESTCLKIQSVESADAVKRMLEKKAEDEVKEAESQEY